MHQMDRAGRYQMDRIRSTYIGGNLDTITEMNYRSHLLIERKIKEDIPLNKKTQGRYFARENNRGRYDTDSV